MQNSGSFRSWTTLRKASPASKKPVHWIMTTGRFPPRSNPAATAIASPSRQTRMSCTLGSARNAGSQVPSSLSGIQTTCVTTHSLKAATTEGPSSIACSRKAHPESRKHETETESLHVAKLFFAFSCFRAFVIRFSIRAMDLVAARAGVLDLGQGGFGGFQVFSLGGRIEPLDLVAVRFGQLLPRCFFALGWIVLAQRIDQLHHFPSGLLNVIPGDLVFLQIAVHAIQEGLRPFIGFLHDFLDGRRLVSGARGTAHHNRDGQRRHEEYGTSQA